MILSRKIGLCAVVLLMLLCSCTGTDFSVQVLAQGEGGAEIKGECSIQVPFGEAAAFEIAVPSGEEVVQVFLDDVLTEDYLWENGTLTIPEVTSPVTVRVVSGNPKKTVYWEADESSRYGGIIHSNVPQGPVAEGSMVTLTAETYEGAVFLGWSERFMIRSGGKLITENEQVTVEITEYSFFCANYDVSGVEKPKEEAKPIIRNENTVTIFYNINGGDLLADGKVALETVFDTSYWQMPFAREDDGTLKKEGHVLLGYSFDPNGEGELIRPGYKYFLPDDSSMFTLYAVWQKETDPADFTIEETDKNTIRITGYTGTDAVVYIPRQIGGKNVTHIAANAFTGNRTLREVHITPTVQHIAAGAMGLCPSLTTITMYDSLRTVSDAVFAGSPVETVRLCAATQPRYIDSGQTYGKKFERLMTTAGTERIIFVSGSSKHCGLDTDYMETLVHEDYSIVNFGTNATMSILFFLEAVQSYLTEDDILVYAPEQYGPYAYYTNG
ncbi:MAG: leucine-rich repeat protein, partial [Clostridia bacterium]|nr:leucine-rich repeat protein [Clostridia bacterium]